MNKGVIMNTEILREYGIGYEKGVARCMGDSELYESILLIFLRDDTMLRAETALKSKDYSMLFECMHELKGVCGNAELNELYAVVSSFVELLRGGNASDDEISLLYVRTESVYNKVKQGILLAKSEHDRS